MNEPSMDKPTRFFHKLLRGFIVGTLSAIGMAFVLGLAGYSKGAGMGLAFYTGVLFGLTSFIVPIRGQKKPLKASDAHE